MTRAAIYARYSSHAQNDESIEQQVAECRAYAAAHDLTVEAVYADRAVTGRTDRRPEFQRLMRAAEKHDFEAVIAYKSNRVARNVYDALRYEKRLDDLGIKLHYCREDFGDNAAGRMMMLMMMTVNQFYSENMAEDIQRGMDENARQCRVNGAMPYGYARGDDGRYVADPATAPIVREIFQRIAAGELKADLARDLNRRGIRTARGGQWNKSSFPRILDNERYTGVYIYNGIRVDGGMPALVTRETFDAAHSVNSATRAHTKARRRHPDMEYLLTGKLYCGECRRPMVGSCGTSASGAVYHYYICQTRGCHKRPVRQDLIERVVLESLVRVISTPDNVARLADLVMEYRDRIIADSDLPNLEAELAGVRRSRSNISAVIEASGVNSTTLAARLVELESSERDLTAAIQREQNKIPALDREHVMFFFESFARGRIDDPQYRRVLVRNFLHRAYVYDDRVTITFNFSDTPIDTDVPECSDEGDEGPPDTAYPNIPRLFGRVFGFSVPLR